MEKQKISFCTVCMNRLFHLQQTLPANLIDNEEYENLEFVILDYNSSDGLENFIMENMYQQIASGRLVYYKTLFHKYFNRSHSRNVVFKVATGDLICNVDADNFTGRGFASYINSLFMNTSKTFLSVIGAKKNVPDRNVLGRLCMKKSDFTAVRGFDERMVDYGFEDLDIVNRMEMLGIKGVPIEDQYLRAVAHPDTDRFSNEFMMGNLETFLVGYIDPSTTEFLFVLKNAECRRGTVVNHFPLYKSIEEAMTATPVKYQFSIAGNRWQSGRYSKVDNGILLTMESEVKEWLDYDMSNNSYISLESKKRYYVVANSQLVNDAILFYSELMNREVMERNLNESKVIVNESGYGMDTVFKNFNFINPISV